MANWLASGWMWDVLVGILLRAAAGGSRSSAHHLVDDISKAACCVSSVNVAAELSFCFSLDAVSSADRQVACSPSCGRVLPAGGSFLSWLTVVMAIV